jgi:hypothetical protein
MFAKVMFGIGEERALNAIKRVFLKYKLSQKSSNNAVTIISRKWTNEHIKQLTKTEKDPSEP